MAGSKAGAAKAKATLLKSLGEDGYKQFYANIGRTGGQNGKGPDYKGGFASSRELAAQAGAIGGAISKRGYKYLGNGEYEERKRKKEEE